MEQNAQRELRSADPQWPVSELMAHVKKAMNFDGPALSFGNCAISHVPQQLCIVVGTSGSSGAVKEVGLSLLALSLLRNRPINISALNLVTPGHFCFL